MYSVKEIFYSLQGEGAQSGRASIFCRFSGCNLWSGREQDRQTAVCNFCDTDFIGTDGQNGGKFKTADDLCTFLSSFWPKDSHIPPYIIFTGGEPALQLDQNLVDTCHQHGFIIAIETNGTKPLPNNIDWVCVSPKADAKVIITSGDELKLVYPQQLARPEQFEEMDFREFYLQPLDSPTRPIHTQDIINFCLKNPRWKLSLQSHKTLGID
ncbi:MULTISPECIES: 7-carboxy-7-deazaguanine synthase [unclassified Neptuniibacter]|jgi:7-carboxy-7-deazaguanine synthase (Cx14CxxC type)|uniref:7-carboxy-7-deazaguanine synthase n=1 Tax=unclassified Neptuniibacter TaxID=2630693 RepID=UPI0026E29254|nr:MULTISPECIES: 7-carboxy-7-deazaguanine synthase [unclassified Neptuniibacter]MDO6513135.1 7-carboxy-7-deazaguanine synthase [Neptuniibacter sp. 2_MG-2023]MDO6592453.1 7-carboxy-7-deazaguanine synthase [Neptuniibacter sp. 1_MG-2023]